MIVDLLGVWEYIQVQYVWIWHYLLYMNAGFVLVLVLWLSLDGGESHAMPLPSRRNVAVSLLALFRQLYSWTKDEIMTALLVILYRAKGFQHQRMTNGAMNVEIGNPAYKIYEGEPDDDAGELLDADFTLDPDKVEKNIDVCKTSVTLHFFIVFLQVARLL